ncbi:MAG: type II toxin-antitoxin system VapC family toxin, partial [Elainella sp.]
MIMVDTGAFVALLDRRDNFHAQAQAAFSKITEPLISTYPVMTEVCFLLNHTAKCSFLRGLSNGLFEVFQLQNQHVDRMVELIERYVDLPMDFADASLVVLAEHLGHGRILTLDRRDFSIYRWQNTNPFQNLMDE